MKAFQPAKRLEDAPKLSTNQPKKRKWRKKKPPAKSDQEVESTPQKEDPPACAGQHLTRPHKSSYFLPGKAAGLIMLYLVDTGCNTKLTSKRIFNRIPQHIQDQLTSCDTHGQMADGTKLPFYGVVQVPIKVKDAKLEEIFVVSQISEDTILGMPFLANHDCRMDFTKPVVTIRKRELVCTDRYGRLMASRVQTVKKITIPPRTEVNLSCRLTSHNHVPEGIIESLSDKVVLASSVNRPGVKGAVLVQCLNPTSQPLELPAGTTIGTFTSMDH